MDVILEPQQSEGTGPLGLWTERHLVTDVNAYKVKSKIGKKGPL